jgi:NAD(P)H-hydrate epimerase
VRITTAAESAARDRGAINAGTPSFQLMLQAGTAAASWLLRECGHHLSHGVALFAGTGNNGGDAYVVAAQLGRADRDTAALLFLREEELGIRVRPAAASA